MYKEKLSNEVFVAVKILNDYRGNGDEFINEVTTMGTMHHVNACSLLSWLLCSDLN